MFFIDNLLNRITMYRLTLYGLSLIAAYALLLGFAGALSSGGVELLASLVVLTAACFGCNYLFSLLYKAPTNIESVFITAFILFFVLAPAASITDAGWLVAASAIAMGSKYLLALKKRHIWNPAALGALAVSLMGSGMAIWWVGTPLLFPVVAVVGLLIVRKIRRFDLFWSFVIPSFAMRAVLAVYTGIPVQEGLIQLLLSWPLLFLATIMLTEPLTTPPSRKLRICYGVLVAVLFSVPFDLGIVRSSPLLALLLGNIFSYAVSSHQRLALRFSGKTQMSANVYEFAFTPDAPLAFTPGQYMEWTLPHPAPDTRGNRRYFTVASAPSDAQIRLGVRIAPDGSSFKKALLALKEGATLSAGALAGEFTLPKDASKKLVFIAGGVGITPFVSMLRDLIARGERRDITLFYAASSEEDFAYKALLEEAHRVLGLKTVYVARSFITEEMLREVPEYRARMFYISGPNAMVTTYRTLLRTLGISRRRIKTDYFPGFV